MTVDPVPNRKRVIALLGRRDEPADGVQDYCECLARGMARQEWALEIVRVPWLQLGWRAALQWLFRESQSWRGQWVLVQYTALAWSRRGFPLGLLYVLWVLRRHGARCVMIFHDTPYPGDRWVDRVRRNFQTRMMRAAYNWSEHSVLTMSLEKVTWLPSAHQKAVFIPVGTNVFSRDDLRREGVVAQDLRGSNVPSLAVFGVSIWPSAQQQEIAAIAHAAREAASCLGELNLLVMGRGAPEAEAGLREALSGSKVALTVYGLLSSREISERLVRCDAMIFVRGGFSTRRSTGLAGIACGVPMIAYEWVETGFPLTEGGVIFVAEHDLRALADEVTRVLKDPRLRQLLRARNQDLFREWFSWDRIVERLISALNGGPGEVREESPDGN